MTLLKMLMIQTFKRRKKIPRLPAPKPAISEERTYLRQLIPYLNAIDTAVKEELLKNLPGMIEQVESLRPEVRKDGASDDVRSAINRIKVRIQREYTPTEIENIARRKGISVAAFNKRVIDENLRRVLGIDVVYSQPWLQEELAIFTTQNSQLITSIADDALRKVETQALEGLRAGTRYEELAKEIRGVIDPSVGNTRARAEFIARDQVSKLTGQLNELRQSELGLKRYIWRTVGDERVRDSHRAHDGKIFSWDDPPSETGHPGEDYQCRCWAEPYFEDLVPGMSNEE